MIRDEQHLGKGIPEASLSLGHVSYLSLGNLHVSLCNVELNKTNRVQADEPSRRNRVLLPGREDGLGAPAEGCAAEDRGIACAGRAAERFLGRGAGPAIGTASASLATPAQQVVAAAPPLFRSSTIQGGDQPPI